MKVLKIKMLWGKMEPNPEKKKNSLKVLKTNFLNSKLGGLRCVTVVLVKSGCTIYKITQIKCMCGVLLFKVMK